LLFIISARKSKQKRVVARGAQTPGVWSPWQIVLYGNN